jgi:hypothetical protein
MSSEIRLGKGTKRAVRQIRWSRGELFSLALIGILALLAVMLGSWLGSHYSD